MVQGSPNLAMNNHMMNVMRRSVKADLEEAGVCMPGAGLGYIVSETAFERFQPIEDFSAGIARKINSLSGNKLIALIWCLILLKVAIFILDHLVDMEQLKVLSILMYRVVPSLELVHICMKLIGVASQWITIKHDRLELIRMMNRERRRLPVVRIHGDEEMMCC